MVGGRNIEVRKLTAQKIKLMRHIFGFQHHWRAIDIRHGRGSITHSLTLQTTAKNVLMTEILYKCWCGKFKTDTVKGHWSLDHFVKERK